MAKQPRMAPGQRYGRLISVCLVGRNARGKPFWQFICDCGRESITLANSVRTGKARSCGCLTREAARRMGLGGVTHGKTGSLEYQSWLHMKDRCLNPTAERYKDYGGRGIRVCEEWMSFERFLADMGERPTPSHSLDRIDTNGHYELDNCRWATPKEQANNRRKPEHRRC